MEQYLLSIKNKKAQGWSLDLVVAGLIFLVGIITLYVYAINYTSQSQKNLDELFYEGNLASELILSEDDFGILSDKRVNQTKLDDYDYDLKKSMFGLTNDFYFIMDNLTIEGSPEEYVGKINITNTESLIQITRITIYKEKPTKFLLYVWK